MDIADKASESPDVRLISDAAHSAYVLEDTELTPADELTEEGEFPQFGDFAEVVLPSEGEGSTEPLHIEVVQDLAAQLVELDIGVGDEFRIGRVSKVDGEWQVNVKAGAQKS